MLVLILEIIIKKQQENFTIKYNIAMYATCLLLLKRLINILQEKSFNKIIQFRFSFFNLNYR